MEGDRIGGAVARIEAALARIETAAREPRSAPAGDDTGLAARHAALRQAVTHSLAQLDDVIEGRARP